jgi:hypothetical protein
MGALTVRPLVVWVIAFHTHPAGALTAIVPEPPVGAIMVGYSVGVTENEHVEVISIRLARMSDALVAGPTVPDT